jgi:hypothetical protein
VASRDRRVVDDEARRELVDQVLHLPTAPSGVELVADDAPRDSPQAEHELGDEEGPFARAKAPGIVLDVELRAKRAASARTVSARIRLIREVTAGK